MSCLVGLFSVSLSLFLLVFTFLSLSLPLLFKEVQLGSPGLTRTQGNPSAPASLELGLQAYITILFCFFKLNGNIQFSIQLRQPLPVLASAHIRQNVVSGIRQ